MDVDRNLMLARRILIGVGGVFVISGVIVTTTYRWGIIPRSYNWQGPLFLVFGLIGIAVAWFLLPQKRVVSIFILALVYIPWTIIGLVGDTKQGYWPLAIGEALGLLTVLWCLTAMMRRAT